MYKYYKSLIPKSFDNMFKPLSEPNRTKNFRAEKVLHKNLEMFPSVFLIKFWNDLSLKIKNSPSIHSFKESVKSTKIMEYKNFRCENVNCYSCRQ